jgi:hypothetical protein
VQIQLSWINRINGEQNQALAEIPVTLGTRVDKMPDHWANLSVTKIVIADSKILPYHALITENNGQVMIAAQNENYGIEVNGTLLPSSTIFDGDCLKIGNVEITINLPIIQNNLVEPQGCENLIGFLFKRRCNRPKLPGSNYCAQCQNQRNLYQQDYNYYPNYGQYRSGRLHRYYVHRNDYYYDDDYNRVEFTEADATAFDKERDRDFEQNFDAS